VVLQIARQAKRKCHK